MSLSGLTAKSLPSMSLSLNRSSMEGAGSAKRPLFISQEEGPPVKTTRTEAESPSVLPRSQRTNDEVHSSIQLGPVIQKFLDTPHMQRLKGLKQLGTADYVFINTNHTRFEHSLGVAELARTLVSKIATAQPCLLCTPSDKLCVELGALMHDIGHGPFSHHYERFVDEQRKLSVPPPEHKDLPPIPQNWCHEDASLMMVDAVLFHLGYTINLDQLDEPLQTTRSNIEPLLAEDGAALTNRDFVFVKEVIVGQPIDQMEAKLGPGFHGRPLDHQEWLYDIVANRRHGLDVDKIDYFARDQRRALRESGEIDKIMIEEAVVAWADCPDPLKCFRCAEYRPQKHLMVCYPKKLISSCMDFFKTRFTLHSKIYQHKTNNAVSFMVRDLLCKADPFFQVNICPLVPEEPAGPKVDYEWLPISRAMNHPGAYVKLQDSILQLIAFDNRRELAPARALYSRMINRDFYKFAGSQVLHLDKSDVDQEIWTMSDREIIQQMLRVDVENGNLKPKHGGQHEEPLILEPDDIRIHKCSIHHGQKDRDPLKMMRFVEKNQLSKIKAANYKDLPEAFGPHEDDYYSRLPRSLMERSIRAYCTEKKKLGLVEHVFEAWWLQLHEENPNTMGSGDLPCLTQDSDTEMGSPLIGARLTSRSSITPPTHNLHW